MLSLYRFQSAKLRGITASSYYGDLLQSITSAGLRGKLRTGSGGITQTFVNVQYRIAQTKIVCSTTARCRARYLDMRCSTLSSSDCPTAKRNSQLCGKNSVRIQKSMTLTKSTRGANTNVFISVTLWLHRERGTPPSKVKAKNQFSTT